MNAAQLKKLIADVPDEAIILMPGSDHGYREATVVVTTVLEEGRRQ